ncbi:M6 family metalloprotease [Pseudovirgaria hyperparasitica]|uniref:M6 family metalloprotease n=1 Tax=Pseudovirgaria hyperparasitica TaxID=470096 RepID=A0A6A6WGF6_9PEZI|nr:M6 family metalloprotease [Pseudovirgaria hyperparasitica]KAF2761154.1 M6 family metalloprotease [Pseudovirgaria hyperparasitica]
MIGVLRFALRGLTAYSCVASALPARSSTSKNDPFAILDLQDWQNPDQMTWDDYVPVPGIEWNDASRRGSVRNFNIALVAVDYPDMNFTITQAAGNTVFDNPQPVVNSLAREDVPGYYRDLLNKVQDLNHGHTLHEYWMEDSAGRYGVDLTAFGAYRLPRKSFQYGIDDAEDGMNPGACPEAPCNVDLRTDALGAWRADVGNETASAFELVFILSAGQDESSTWQEFGEMKFQTKEDVPADFGPPAGLSNLTNYAATRYVEWTSWVSAASIWPNAGGGSSTQGESSGAAVYAHELSHLIGIGDNYNNPYGLPARRAYTGPWSMMSRGSFNGPGGPHTRWQIPALQGASLGSLHTVRDKLQLGLVDNSSVLMTSREELTAYSGVLVARLTARAVDEGPDGLKGLRINIDSDDSPACNISTDPLCDAGGYNFYDLEVVQRIGADSFQADSGVLLSKGQISDARQPFQWVIDANPQDIDVVDFVRPDGTESMLTVGDYRQLMDALFHAGTRSGSQFEYVDEANNLHFYVVEPEVDESGVLYYTVGVKSLLPTSSVHAPSKYGVDLLEGKASPGSPSGGSCTFILKNTGEAASGAPLHLSSDIYRLSAEVDGSGWQIVLPNELATARFGQETVARVAFAPAAHAIEHATIKLTATSESDNTVVQTQTCQVSNDRGYEETRDKSKAKTRRRADMAQINPRRPNIDFHEHQRRMNPDDYTICPAP